MAGDAAADARSPCLWARCPSLHAHTVAGGLRRRAVELHARTADLIVRHLHDALDELGVVQLGGM